MQWVLQNGIQILKHIIKKGIDVIRSFIYKTVLFTANPDIKEKYRKKNIFIKGDVSVDDLKDVKGIVDIIKHAGELEVKIEDINCVDNVFKKIKTLKRK